jgi:hypothetical protein
VLFGVAFMAASRVLMLFGSTMRLVRRWRLLLTVRYLFSLVGFLGRRSWPRPVAIVDRVLICCIVPRICPASGFVDFLKEWTSSQPPFLHYLRIHHARRRQHLPVHLELKWAEGRARRRRGTPPRSAPTR